MKKTNFDKLTSKYQKELLKSLSLIGRVLSKISEKKYIKVVKIIVLSLV